VCLDILKGASHLTQQHASDLAELLRGEERAHLPLLEALLESLGQAVHAAREPWEHQNVSYPFIL
jgi:hypothetical protein